MQSCHSPNRVIFVQSLVAGIIGMGLIAVSFTGSIDKLNTSFGLTPRNQIFTIQKSESEKLNDLLAKLQVEAPEELNVDVGNGVSVDTPLKMKFQSHLIKKLKRVQWRRQRKRR